MLENTKVSSSSVLKCFKGVTFFDKVSVQPHTIVKQICFPNGNVLFLSLFSLFKNWMHNVVWGCAEILPFFLAVDNSEQKMYETILTFISNRKTFHNDLRFYQVSFASKETVQQRSHEK